MPIAAANSEELLSFRDVTVRFGAETIYEDFSFSVVRGEFLIL